MKKYQDGGKTGAGGSPQPSAPGTTSKKGKAFPTPKGAIMKIEGTAMKKKGQEMKAKGTAMKAKGQAMKANAALGKKAALRTTYTPGVRVGSQSMNSDGSMNYSMKTGGMVNSNAKVTASKVASGRPAKSAEPKSAAKQATGRVGGISKAPKSAMPKMKMGGSKKAKSC